MSPKQFFGMYLRTYIFKVIFDFLSLYLIDFLSYCIVDFTPNLLFLLFLSHLPLVFIGLAANVLKFESDNKKI